MTVLGFLCQPNVCQTIMQQECSRESAVIDEEAQDIPEFAEDFEDSTIDARRRPSVFSSAVRRVVHRFKRR